MNPHLPYRRTSACSHVGAEPLLYYHDWQLLEHCDGVKPASSVAKDLGISEFAITESLERLLTHGLIKAEAINYGDYWHASQSHGKKERATSANAERVAEHKAMLSAVELVAARIAQLEQALTNALGTLQAHTPTAAAAPAPVAAVEVPAPQAVAPEAAAPATAQQQAAPLAQRAPSALPTRAGVTSGRGPSPAAPVPPGFAAGQPATRAAAPAAASQPVAPRPQPQPAVPPAQKQTQLPQGQQLKPLVDAIIAKAGGGTKGQLAVYRVFLKVPSHMLAAAGLGKLSLIDQTVVIRDSELWTNIVRAAQEVAGLDYSPV